LKKIPCGVGDDAESFEPTANEREPSLPVAGMAHP